MRQMKVRFLAFIIGALVFVGCAGSDAHEASSRQPDSETAELEASTTAVVWDTASTVIGGEAVSYTHLTLPTILLV